MLFSVFLHKSRIGKKSGFWDSNQNALKQSNYSRFISDISLEQNYVMAWYWRKFLKIKSLFNIFFVGMVKNGFGHSRQVTQNWLYLKDDLMRWTDFVHVDANAGKLKITFMIFGWCGQKWVYAGSQEWTYELSWIFERQWFFEWCSNFWFDR